MLSKGFLAKFVLLLVIGVGNAQLSPTFYDSTCPQFASLVIGAVSTAVSRERRMGASLLRLHFHDCFVEGCDASVLLDDTATFTGEKSAVPNANSLRGFEVIDNIKAQVERACPGVVSCADILALAARDSVVALGGSTWTVQFGRRDSTTASLSGANSQLPAPFRDLSRLISDFSNKGFTTSEMVALSGGHTIGQARCTQFRNRIYNDTNIDAAYATSLQGNCPRTAGTGDNNLAPFDPVTPNDFDNSYYRNLVAQRGLLHSDQELLNSAATSAQVTAYSRNSASFFNDFAAAMVKMSNLSPLTGTQGQIRTNCRRVN